MSPDQVAAELRRIASKIERSKSPDRTLVARDIRSVVSSVRAGASRLMTSGGEDPSMGDLFGEKGLEAKVKAYLKSVKDLFNVDFALREIDIDDNGAGHAVFEYMVPEAEEPESFNLEWDPSDTYSDFIAKLSAEIFGWEMGANEGEESEPQSQAPALAPEQGQGQPS
jgi:hypothetical protein